MGFAVYRVSGRLPQLRCAAAGEYAVSLAEFNTNNALALRKLLAEGTVKILKFDDVMLKAFARISKEVVAETGSRDEISRRVYASYRQFRSLIGEWSDVSERTYLNSRHLA